MSIEITTPAAEETQETYWRRILQQWEASGLKGREFQRRNNLSQHAFIYWKLKLIGRTEKGPKLVPVKLRSVDQPAMRSAHGIRIRVGELFTIELAESFDATALHQVLTAVRDCAR